VDVPDTVEEEADVYVDEMDADDDAVPALFAAESMPFVIKSGLARLGVTIF
jgi:hypothetical protein